jgi:hypothetical protein
MCVCVYTRVFAENKQNSSTVCDARLMEQLNNTQAHTLSHSTAFGNENIFA